MKEGCFYPKKHEKSLNIKDINAKHQIITRRRVWNHHGVMHGINPKEDTPAVMPYTLRVITYA